MVPEAADAAGTPRTSELAEIVGTAVEVGDAHSTHQQRPEAPADQYEGAETMRFIAMVHASEQSEAGVMPTEDELAAMGAFNEELVKAGVMLAGEGLHPTSRGARVVHTSGGTTVVDGPFAETKELIAGFWILQASSYEEALEWLKRAPRPSTGEFVIELRKVFDAEDFGEAFTPELQEQEARIRAEAERVSSLRSDS
jgi:hypothetical protein